MSNLKIKQIAGPASGKAGSVIVYEGSTPKWSTDLTSSLILPTGNTAARPQAAENGAIRYNSETHRVEALEEGEWISLSDGVAAFEDLQDGPGMFTGNAGKSLRVKSDATGLEYFDIPTGLRRYRFRINYTGATNPTGFAELPAGWTVALVPGSSVDLIITHNLNKLPAMTFVYGRIFPSGTNTAGTIYQQRLALGSSGTALSFQYDTANLNICYLIAPNALNVSTYNGGHAYVDLYFMND